MIKRVFWEHEIGSLSLPSQTTRQSNGEAVVCKTAYRGSLPLSVSMAYKHLLDDVCSCKVGKWDRYLHGPPRRVMREVVLSLFAKEMVR